jgi:hypothetical protein
MQVVLSIQAPYLSMQKYADMTGESIGAIRGQLERGDIPSYFHENARSRNKGQGENKGKGSTRYVDLTKITMERLRASGVSVLTKASK